ncbi:MAG: hypothetical protein QOI03_1476 [Solirubrobacteraceae bacterium]|nr:hypothetical protein [Solirubrobacteraceae bacterium]
MHLPGSLQVPDDLPVRAVSVCSTHAPSDAAPALTEEQEQSVARRSEALSLSAGAGSGKTSVLVERFVRAVCEDGVAPAQILAITFTERAAGELRARVRRRLLGLGEREAARDTEAAFVGTFHAFCARLLRSHTRLAGLDPDFAILEEGLAARLRGEAFAGAARAFLEHERDEAVELIAAYDLDNVRVMIEGAYLALRSRGSRAPRLPLPVLGSDAGEPDRAAASACSLLDELLALFGEAYEQIKRARAAVDFDDLELLAYELLERHETVRSAWSERFALLMVDEFQDTNPRQLGILRALERQNLFTVGDEHQAIYGFRHADVRLFRARRSELAERGASLELTHNFRSRASLLAVVNAVFGSRFENFSALLAARTHAPAPSLEEPSGQLRLEQPRSELHVERLPGRLGLEEPAEPAVEMLLTSTRGWEQDADLAGAIGRAMPAGALWRQAEAHLLAERISELVRSGRALAGEVVVLFRAGGDIDVYERALRLRGLRTLAAVGGFWAQQQIAELLSFLAVLANPLDEQALYSTLASPLVGCSSDALALLADAARASSLSAWETALLAAERGELLGELPERERETLVSFCAQVQRERRGAPMRSISQLIERAIGAHGYRAHVLALEWGERRLANIHKLMRIARRFEASEGYDLRGFLDHAAHLREAPSSAEADAPVDELQPDAVRLMTIHAAKGLEFPVVCVADLGRSPNSRSPSLIVDGERLGLRLQRLDGEKAAPALDYEELCEERALAEAQEEDRIVYVAMTRARELLLLSGAVDFERWPEQRQGAPTISWLGLSLAAELPALAAAADVGGDAQEVALGARADARVRLRLSTPALAATLLGLGTPRTPIAPASARPAPAGVPIRAEETQRTAHHDRPATLSYTTLSELERCGYRYYLERVLGLSEDRSASRAQPAQRGLEATARGTLIHRLLEELDLKRPQPPSAREVGRVARELGMRVSAGEREEISTLIAAAARSQLAQRLARLESARREHPLAFALGDGAPLLVGVIDLIAEEPHGGHLVLDYKSDRVGPDVDLEELVTREYGMQRTLYALAVLRSGAASVEVVHWFLQRPGEWAGATFSQADRPELEQLLAARVARALEGEFRVSDAPHRALCETCPGRASLCSWSEAQTLSEQPAV